MKKTVWFSILIVLLMSVSAVMAQDISGTPDDICASASLEEPATREYTGAELVIEPGVDYQAIFCTQAGAVYIDLWEDFAPVTVNNMVFLAQQGYYNNTTFHRVLADFMAQGGDPTGTGAGGPGYQFRDEIVGFTQFDRPGLLAMANAGPATNGSQFFITTAETPWLNGNHTIFGEVLSGYDNVLNLNLRDPQSNPATDGDALNTIVIVTADDAIDAEISVNAVEPVGLDVFSTAHDQLFNELPEGLVASAGNADLMTDEVVASLPEAVQSDFADIATANGHEWRIVRGVDNSTCNEQFFFTNITYTVDRFESAESAQAVIDSGILATLAEAQGLVGGEPGEIVGLTVFTSETTDCTDAAAQNVLTYLVRGRYLVTLSGLIPEGVLAQISAEELLDGVVAPLFENFLVEGYASELR